MIAMHLVEFTCQANTRTALMSVCCGLLCRLSLSPPLPCQHTHTHSRSVPPYMSLLARSVATLEGIALTADPQYQMVAQVRVRVKE